MGKGDRRTKRGKISAGSYGNARVKKSTKRKRKREAGKQRAASA